MEEFLTMAEFSKLSGIERRTLRWWDEIGLFCPAYRGEKNKYRYYSLNQIITIKFILILRNINIPIKTIISIINNKNPKLIIELLENQKKIIDLKLQELTEISSVVNTRCELLKLGLDVNLSNISLIKLQEKVIKLGPLNNFKKDEGFYNPFSSFCKQAEKFNINLNFPIGGYHSNIEKFFYAPNEPEYFFSFDIDGMEKQEESTFLVGYTRGYYGEISELAKRMKIYAIENNIELSGPVYTIYLHDELCTKNHHNYLAQVCITVENKNQ